MNLPECPLPGPRRCIAKSLFEHETPVPDAKALLQDSTNYEFLLAPWYADLVQAYRPAQHLKAEGHGK